MIGLRQFIRSRRSSRLIALWIAYSLAIQTLMASVGFGMSALAAPGQSGSFVCSHAAAGAPVPTGDRHNPGSAPPCPFCYVATQSAGYIPIVAEAPISPRYVGLPTALVPDRIGDTGFVPQFHRMVGAPRAPPAFSV